LPRVLLFGCDRALVDRLRNDSRWEVAVAEHSEGLSPGIPDPRYWNLVVDDCANVNEVYGFADAEEAGIPFYKVPAKYMREMSRAHGIHFAGSDWEKQRVFRLHLNARADEPVGYKDLEFNPSSQLAELLTDFVEEFEPDFAPSRLVSWMPRPGGEPGGQSYAMEGGLFQDAYASPLLCLRDGDFP